MTTGFAVDLGGTKTAVARITDNRIETVLQAPTDGQAGFDAQLDTIARLLAEVGFRAGERLGVAVAGMVDSAGFWRAANAATLPEIRGEPLRERLCDRFGADNTTIINDAAAAALAEARLGAGVGADHFAYLTISTGVGGGVVLNGHLLASRNGLAGHVGLMSSPFGNDLCGSGRRGTVESVASGRAIAVAAGTPDARAAFATDTRAATLAIERSTAAISRLCADLTAAFGLDRIALGGSVGLADGYLQQVQRHLTDEPPLFRVPVVAAKFRQHSALLEALIKGH